MVHAQRNQVALPRHTRCQPRRRVCTEEQGVPPTNLPTRLTHGACACETNRAAKGPSRQMHMSRVNHQALTPGVLHHHVCAVAGRHRGPVMNPKSSRPRAHTQHPQHCRGGRSCHSCFNNKSRRPYSVMGRNHNRGPWVPKTLKVGATAVLQRPQRRQHSHNSPGYRRGTDNNTYYTPQQKPPVKHNAAGQRSCHTRRCVQRCTGVRARLVVMSRFSHTCCDDSMSRRSLPPRLLIAEVRLRECQKRYGSSLATTSVARQLGALTQVAGSRSNAGHAGC